MLSSELEITFIEKPGGERKFPSLTALKEQIASDIESANVRWP